MTVRNETAMEQMANRDSSERSPENRTPAALGGWLAQHRGSAAAALGLGIVAASFAVFQKGHYPFAAVAAALAYLAIGWLSPRPQQRLARQLAEMRFAELDISSVPPDGAFAQHLTEHLLRSEPALIDLVQNILQEFESRERRYLLSLALSRDLVQPPRTAAYLEEQVSRQFMHRLLDRMLQDSGASGDLEGRKDELRSDLAGALRLEVWFHAGIPAGSLYYQFKREITVGDRANYVLASKGGRLRQRMERADRKYLSGLASIPVVADIPVVVGPPDLGTSVIDIESEHAAGSYNITDIASSASLKSLLDVRTTEIVGVGWPIENRVMTHQKGYLRLVGSYRDGQFIDLLQPEYKDLLDRTVPNVLRREIGGEDAFEKIKPLLVDFMSKDTVIAQHTVHSAGNFRIEWSSEAHQGRYCLTPLPNSATRYWFPAMGGGDRFRDPRGYQEFPQEQGTPIPFSAGYLMTGIPAEDSWLCLEVNVGSPGVMAARGDWVKVETADLERIVAAFAHAEGLEKFDLRHGNFGVVARCEASGEGVFLTLPDPMHVNRYVLKTVLRRLTDAGLFPPEVRLSLLDRRGRATADGSLLIVRAPECELLVDVVPHLGEAERLRLLGQLLNFTRGVLAEGVVCVDFTLDQTARWKGSVFVCDYTAYMFANNLGRKTVKKPEHEAPEELHAGLPLEAEAFSVFTLGVLFYQTLFAEASGGLPFPEEWERRKLEGGARYTDSLRAELHRRLGRRALADLVGSMLAWNPKDRPSLARVEEALDRP